MADTSLDLAELDEQIAIIRNNLRELIEKAAAQSGAGDEDLLSRRIAAQEDELNRLTERRERLLKSKP